MSQIDIEGQCWTINRGEPLVASVCLSLLWLAAIEGSAQALGLMSRIVGSADRAAHDESDMALRAIARTAAHFGTGIELRLGEAQLPAQSYEIYDADAPPAVFIPQSHLPPALKGAAVHQHVMVCATRGELFSNCEAMRHAFPWMAGVADTLCRSQHLRSCVSACKFGSDAISLTVGIIAHR